MDNITFPCPFCGKKMAVGEALVGKKVRCPTCKQIVLAPTSSAPVAPPPPPAKIAPAQPAAFDDLPVFNVAPRESHESIFSPPEESEDEIFGSNPGVQLRRPDLPPPQEVKPANVVVPTQPPADDNPFGFSDEPAPAPPPPPPPPARPKAKALIVEEIEPTADYTDPFGGFEDPPPQAIPDAILEPIPQASSPPPPAVVAVPYPAATPVAPKVAAVLDEEEDEAPAPVRKKLQPTRRPAVTSERSGPGMGFYVLLGYAILMTAMTLYGFLFRYGTQLDPGHPLSTIPDNFGEFPPAERKKTSQLNRIIDNELPPQLRVALGKKLEIGQLEIEPTKVEARPLEMIAISSVGKQTERTTPSQAVVLTLRIRNSGDGAIYPMDPAFLRKFIGNTDEPKPGTALVVGKDFFRGSDIAWPPTARNAPVREFERAQDQDSSPLKPGESRDYVVFTAAERKIAERVKNASEPMLWRVQVRRGVIDLKGKDVPVTAIIGVEFRANDVREN